MEHRISNAVTKKVIPVILCVLLVCSTAGFAGAATIDRSVSEIKHISIAGKVLTVSKTVSDYEISLLPERYVKTADTDGVLISVARTLTTISDDTAADISKSISTKSTIPASKLEIFVCVYQISEKPGKDNFKFHAYAEWNSQPILHLTDKLAMAWSDDFTLYYDSCKLYNDIWPSGAFGYCTRSSVTPEAGVSYDCPMRIGAGGYTPAFDSYAFLLSAKVYKDNSSGSANVVSQYAHKTFGLGIGVSFSPAPSISFSGAAIYDLSIPDYAAFSY